MIPEIDIGPVTIQTFGLMFAVAFIVSGAVVWRRLEELGRPPDWAYEILLVALVGGIVGARGYWMVENLGSLDGDLLANLFAGDGLTWYGGVVGGAAGVVIWAWYRDYLRLELIDIAAPTLLLGQAIGRIGCQLSGDGDYGKAWDGPWAMAYPDGVVPIDTPVHPTPIYETISLGIGAWILWRLRDRFRPGILFAFYLVYGGAARFLVEFVRRNEQVLAGLTAAQLISLAMVIGGATWLLAARSRYGALARPAGQAA